MFFSDLEVELLTLKIFFLIFFEFCFWNLKKKFKADVLIFVGSKIGQNLGPVHWIEKKLFSKKKHFLIKIFFSKEKKFGKKCFFSKKPQILSNFLRFNAHGIQILSNFTLTLILKTLCYIILFKVPKKKIKKKKKSKIKFLRSKVQPSSPVCNKLGGWNLELPLWRGLSPTVVQIEIY